SPAPCKEVTARLAGTGSLERGDLHVVLPAHAPNQLPGVLAKARQRLLVQRRFRWRQHGSGIVGFAVDEELEVQVRPAGPSGLTDEADDLPLADAGACLELGRELAHVRV